MSSLQVKKGISDDNSVYTQALALCPVLAITTTAMNGVAMGVASLLVLIASCVIISLLRKAISPRIRIPCFIMLCATFLTIVRLLMQAYFPALHDGLGFLLFNIGTFSNSLISIIAHTLGMAAGLALALVFLAGIRERLDDSDIPTTLKGLPITMIASGSMSLVFIAFAGMF